MCRINYDNNEDIKQQVLRQSQDHDHVGSSRVRQKFGRSSEVQREQIREVQKLAKRSSSEHAKWIVAKSRSMPDVCRRITEGLLDDRRKFAGNSPKEAIDAPEQAAKYVLGNNRS